MAVDVERPTPARQVPGHLVALRDQLTVQEKVALLVGADMWTTTAVPRLGLRPVTMSDGPAGVRGTGAVPDETAAAFPAPSALGATWDVELAARVGAVFAVEARRHGVDVILAPQVNLQRTPVAGRHFECYSEDPVLTAALTVPLVRAAQNRGVGMCVKHYVANDSETQRTSYVARLDERTLREVYLAPFEALVRDVGAWAVMGAYSGVDDGTESAPVLEHRRLLTDVLKDEWGFDGVLVSDWVATKSVTGPVRAGMDLQMPGPDGPWGDGLAAAVAAGEVTEAELDDKVLRLLLLASRVGALGDGPADPGTADVPGVLREWAARSLVVLKDDDHLLPLAAPRTLALVGPNAVVPFLQGGGSSMVAPDRTVSLPDALATAFPGARVTVHRGAASRLTAPPLDLARATAPDGRAGVLAELLDEAGGVIRSWVTSAWSEDVPDLPDEADALRLRTTLRLDEPGEHRIGVGSVGRRRIVVDGVEVSVSDVPAGADVVLDSSWNHPQAVLVPVQGPASVDLDATVQVVHPVGYDTFLRARLHHQPPAASPEQVRAEAVAAAATADVAVVVVGSTEEVESEGWDRTDLALPGDQDELVRAVLAVQPRTVVVVNAGAPMVLPWLDRARCVVWGWLGGQEWPAALADAVSGVIEPSGRLPWTLPAREADVPVPHAVPADGVVEYREGVHVGHRSWDLLDREPAAPFGHGLGWTEWEYTDAQVAFDEQGSAVDVTVTNVGPRAGREVVQVYVEPPTGRAPGADPVRRLAGFALVDAEPGASATVRVPLHPHALRTWDHDAHRWTAPSGTTPIRVGRSSRDLRLTTHLDPHLDPPRRPGDGG